MNEFWDFIWLLLGQFAGGPGPKENNLVRFGLPAIFWAILWWIAWTRQRREDVPREKWLVWGFGLGFAREAFMFLHIALKLITHTESDTCISEPLEHALAMAATVVVAASFVRYILDDEKFAKRYLNIGVGSTAFCYLITFLWWPWYNARHPEITFHQTVWAWLFHIFSSVLVAWAIYVLSISRRRGWLRNVVSVALSFFFLGEALMLINFATQKAYDFALCRISNTFHILAIPVLAYVYFREQAIEKALADEQLRNYRDHLEELVAARTEALRQEIAERKLAEAALAQLSHRNELILKSAGEGIFGIDADGKHIFVNPAAARMLGYEVDALIGQPSHSTWHHTRADGTPYPEEMCPIHAGYKAGTTNEGDDQVFWRKDGTSFPARYTSTPMFQDGELAGAVVVFQDITEHKQFEAAITRRNAELAAQNTIAATLNQSLHLDAVLNTTLDAVMGIFDMDVGGIHLFDPTSEMLTLRAYRGGSTSPEMALPAMSPVHVDTCFSGRAIRELRTVLHERVWSNAEGRYTRVPAFIAETVPETVVSTPLVSRGQAVGVLTLGAGREYAFPEAKLRLLSAIGQQIGMALENARLYQETEDLAEQLTLLHQASIILSSTLDPEEIYVQITALASKLLDCQVTCMYTWDDEHQRAANVSNYTVEQLDAQCLDVPAGELPCLYELIARRRSIAVEDAENDPRVPPYWREKLNIRALLCLPLWTKDRPLGLLYLVDQRTPRRWRPDEVILAQSFANRAAIAVENAYLHQEVERTATMQERGRIAAELHDGLGQTLSYIGLTVDHVADIDAGEGAAGYRRDLEKVRAAVDQASSELRAAIDHLLSRQSQRKPLQDVIRDIVASLSQEHDVHIDVENNVDFSLFLSPDQLEQVPRVVQESLLNAIRHAQAEHIGVTLHMRGESVVITVTDDGRGFDPEAQAHDRGHHFGLSVMQARATRIEGHVDVVSAPGEGTLVVFAFPLAGPLSGSAKPD